ncbi:hypothetical protein ACFOW1_15400 [Parasediminibacterium paludis]|uniref:Uncharacterized protein n=1 Tax=Parasediminibacterium paludis TaxID=908966 RepID=A0ABV8Q270_9BACT
MVILTYWADILAYPNVFVQNSVDIFTYRYVFVANCIDIFADCYVFVTNCSDIFADPNVLIINGLVASQKAIVHFTKTRVCIAYLAGNCAKPNYHLLNSLSLPNKSMV